MDLIGKTVGNYQVIEEIGRGGMGTVYRAHQTSLNRPIALKVLAPALAQQDNEFFRRFRQEAEATAALDHPNIIHIYDTGEDQGVHFIAMEYIGGGNLLARMKQAGGPLPPAEAVSIVAQIAVALDYAHRNKIVHRDVKPSNILLDSEGRAVLSDLGIARALEGTRLTHTGITMGTPEYMSPEQAQGNPVDGRADLYSLGVVLFEMVTGKIPFQGDTPLVTLYKQIHDSPPDPSKLNPKLSRKFTSALVRVLAKDPAKRYATGQQMANALIASVPGAHAPIAAPGTTVKPSLTPKAIAVNTLDTARSVSVRTAQGIGRFLLALLKTFIEAIAAAAVLIVLISVIFALVFSFVLAQYAQNTLRDYNWYFQDMGPMKPYIITSASFNDLAAPYVTNHTFGAISAAGLGFVPPNQINLSAKVLGYSVVMDGSVYTANGLPQLQVQHLNGMPLPVIDGILSNGINQGLQDGWSKAPVRVSRFVVTDQALTIETDFK